MDMRERAEQACRWAVENPAEHRLAEAVYVSPQVQLAQLRDRLRQLDRLLDRLDGGERDG
jgi:ribosome assembly protein YihI (activator of Der GTPase)